MGGSIAVIDVETTGLFPRRNDRVLEVAAVIVEADGSMHREFCTLVNPSRDIGPSRIHGLTCEDVIHAPEFAQIAGLLIETLDGAVAIAAHNARFDQGFLASEFTRAGLVFPECRWLCTMQLAGGGSLAECAAEFGVSSDFEAHSALADARVAAELLIRLLADDSLLARQLRNLPPISWPVVGASTKRPVTRNEARRRRAEPPTYLQRILAKAGDRLVPCTDDAALLAYSAILTRAMEDRQVDDTDAEALCEVASDWGLDRNQVIACHREYLLQLAAAALADGIISDSERRDILLASRLLGECAGSIDNMLDEAAAIVEAAGAGVEKSIGAENSLVGRSVCFTGELQCLYHGEPISRKQAESLAEKAGLFVAGSVTKKLDLLVVADPLTQSGKAAKARRYGVRILHEPVFWRAIGIPIE